MCQHAYGIRLVYAARTGHLADTRKSSCNSNCSWNKLSWTECDSSFASNLAGMLVTKMLLWMNGPYSERIACSIKAPVKAHRCQSAGGGNPDSHTWLSHPLFSHAPGYYLTSGASHYSSTAEHSTGHGIQHEAQEPMVSGDNDARSALLRMRHLTT